MLRLSVWGYRIGDFVVDLRCTASFNDIPVPFFLMRSF